MIEAKAAPEMPLSVRALTRMLDIVDYGMLVVVSEAQVVYLNQIARAELDDDHPFHLVGGELRARRVEDLAPWRQALSRALRRGMQAMLALGGVAELGISVSVVPLDAPGEEPAALVILGKRRVCEELSSDAFARLHDLTAAETRVLKLLSAGYRPGDIAMVLGVRLTTVRTQITSIRAKTGSRDIGEIVHRIARLPPLPCLLRSGA